MSSGREHFKDIDFEKAWDESDWDRFFQAQEAFLKDVRGVSFRPASAKDPGLSFQNVLRRMGMNPDSPDGRADEDISNGFGTEDASVVPRAAKEFWEDEAPVELLPVYRMAGVFAARFRRLCDEQFDGVLVKPYKSRSHRRTQDLLLDIHKHVFDIPRFVDAGHRLGYSPEMVNGNIVRCKKAFQSADACVGMVSKLATRRLSKDEYQSLFRETLKLRSALRNWISFLRIHFA